MKAPRLSWSSIIILLNTLLIHSCLFANAKVSSGDVLLTGAKTEALLTKFAISHAGKFELTLTIPASRGMYTDERFIRLHMFNDVHWKKAKEEPLCAKKIAYADHRLPIEFDYARDEKTGEEIWKAEVTADEGIHAQMDKNGNERVTFWYISIDDCSLERYNHAEKDAPRMEYKYTIKNAHDDSGSFSHFSAEQDGMNTLHVVQIVTSASLLTWIVLYIIQKMMSSNGQVHIALLTVASALSLDILSCISEFFHTVAYARNGVGIYTFDCLASHFEAQCDALIALVLILVGSGWTLPSDVVATGSSSSAMIGTSSIIQNLVMGLRSPSMAMRQLHNGNPVAALLFLSILVAHAVLAQWGRTFDEDFDTFHGLDHTAGRTLMKFRIALAFIFLLGSASVRNNGRFPNALKPFMFKFQLVGMSWFLSLPFVSTASNAMLVDHRKHVAMAVGSTLVQSCSLASLVWLFTADSSASPYHRMNNLQKDNATLSGGFGGESLGGSGSPRGRSLNIWKFGKTKIRLD